MKAYIEIETDNAEDLYRALKVEERNAISHAKVYLSGKKLIISIEAEDISDLRAAVNSWLRLVKMCEEISGVIM